MGCILTFDLGTTYFKTCLFDTKLRLVACHRVAPQFAGDHIGRSELSAVEFENCLCDSVRAISLRYDLRQVEAVTFASQANTFTLLDANDRPLVPLIRWTDARAADQEPWLRDFAAGSRYYAITGIPTVSTEFLVAKVRWLQQHEPNLIEQTQKLCCLSDYLTLWLTGNFLSEEGLAGMTGLADIHQRAFCRELLELAEIPPDWLPEIVQAGTDAGAIRREVASRMGLPHTCRLVVGCLDQYAGAIGVGNTEPDRVSVTTGTVLATVRCAEEFCDRRCAEVFQGTALKEGHYYQMMFSNISAVLLEVYRSKLPDRPELADLDRLAETIPMGAEGLRINARAASQHDMDGLFEGRSSIHARGHEVRAILEGVAEELRRQLQILCAGALPDEVLVAGGGARSRLWLEITSQLLGIPVQSIECPEPTSLGAARIARATICGDC